MLKPNNVSKVIKRGYIVEIDWCYVNHVHLYWKERENSTEAR